MQTADDLQNQAFECPITIEDDRTGVSVATLRRAMADNLQYIQGRLASIASKNDFYMALAYTVRDRLLRHWLATQQTYVKKEVRVVCYFSAEYLVGPHLGNNLINLGIYQQVEQAVQESGLNLQELMAQEEEPGLGNGGLGRLAACFMDSLSSLEIPAIGYGIRYEYGIFDQEIRDGWQVEITDKWLRYGNPWEIVRPENAMEVKFGGHTEAYIDHQNKYQVNWVPHTEVIGIPYDTPILGYKVNTANTMRLWKAEAPESFDFEAFNKGDYYGAVAAKMVSENITKVLYPNDEQLQGKELRLQQQYFFVCCSLQDIIRIHLLEGESLETLPDKVAIQLNDTHPAIAVAELMRLLIDQHDISWDQAWAMTQKIFSYTNHTLLPEALERWPLPLFQNLLPRHLEIIYEINTRFLNQVRIKFPGDADRLRRMSIIDESGDRFVRMAHLACVGSHAVNGVAELHSELLKQTTLHDFYQLHPEKFKNVTNGVTPRRWLVLINPHLTQLITSKIGDGWMTHLDQLQQLEAFVEDVEFRHQWRDIKRLVKENLATEILQRTGVVVNPDTMFDVQAKRIHEYKRQHLNVFHIVTLYNRIKQNLDLDLQPRTFIFGGKAAPGYYMAKLMIKLITAVGEVVNNDPDVRDRLKVVFLPDYNVTNAQRVYPAADLSEQISTAGYEASGTGNMKFSMNGALTIGTLDGANIEIRQQVGAENFFLFGLNAAEVLGLKAKGYHPTDYYTASSELKGVIDLIKSGHFSGGDCDLFNPLINGLMQADPFMLLADYQAYIDCQDQVSAAYRDQDHWTRMSILNAARMGKFSSDRSIRDYSRDIWQVKAVPVELSDYDQEDAMLQVK